MGRVARNAFLIAVAIVGTLVPGVASADRLLVPGGSVSLRRETGIPDHVPDSMLLSEAARAWFGVRQPIPADARHAAALAAYLATSKEPLQPGPWLPLSTATWMRLLEVKSPDELSAALARSRNAMLLYRGLTGVDDRTLTWFETQPELLADIFEHMAPVFATVGPFLSITPEGIAVPGGAETTEAWHHLVGAPPADPARFVKALLERDNSRIAWMFGVMSALDPARARFVTGERGSNLSSLAAHFVRIAPEWTMLDRAFSRPSFDPSVVLMLLRPSEGQPLAGTDDFWRKVFASDVRDREPAGASLTAATLIDILFDDAFQAHARWEVFALGQRMMRTAKPNRETVAALQAAMRFPVLALSLERVGALTPDMLQQLSQAAGRITRADGDGRRGDLAAWQAALATVERSSLNGGIDRPETMSLLTSFARLPLSSPRRELTAWLLDVWIDRLLSRPGAPADAEEALLRTMAGDLHGRGGREPAQFTWEDLPYTLAVEQRALTRMREARMAQAGPTLADAHAMWRGSRQEVAAVCTRLQEMSDEPFIGAAARHLAGALAKNDAERVNRERRDLADAIVVRALPRIAYAPQQAASDAPALGADVAFRHEIVMAEGALAGRQRPWQLAIEVAFEGKPWHLAGSLLSLDIPLSGWYLRTNGDAPMGTPMIEEPDTYAMALTAVLGSAEEVARFAATLNSVEAGRARVAQSQDLASADAVLASRGIDPWRRRALSLDAASPSDIAAGLTPSEAWRIGGSADVPIVPAFALDGCPCLGEMPFAPMIAEGRMSNGTIGAIVPGLALRIATFLKKRGLPLALYRPLAGGVAFDVIHSAAGVRMDDMQALDVAAAAISDARLEEHVLALVADGTLAAPAPEVVH